ncbi:hypothetical protein FNZ56_05600 [Pseudoluteimonas lycopersici]|uniref:Lipoprotein n=1 Tax=Pseudoluteimonas lycopersici TaxID=1324796 RepID=A0A516V8B7_9GAMM|nr:hypothetical protein FNZ56_05600 [Lysobacter lycopersici]
MFTRFAVVSLLLAPMLAACATDRAERDAAKLALYRAHAGAPVRSFHFFGRLDSWTSLDDRTVAVWTRPSEAWLLDLDGTCNGLEFTPFIGLTSSAGTVSAKFDKVLVRDGSPMRNLPCIIETIRPLDVKAIKQAERGEHDATQAPADQPSGT